jgi:catabolite regulation protein CreA
VSVADDFHGMRMFNASDAPTDAFDDPNVQTVLTYVKKWRAVSVMARLDSDDTMHLAKRQDRHEDGSISTTYYLELTEDQYKALGGR